MTGQLCLRWNNHSSAFNKLLGKIYLEDMYSDGTIVCQGKFYPVHRFVLSTCSEVFEQMFKQCVRLNNKHPFIIVKDINPEQMEALLNYMYKGEVNVPQEMLPELIKAAEAFKIKGLAVPDEEPSQKSSRKRSSASSPSSLPKKSRRQDEKLSSNSKNISNVSSEDDNHATNTDRISDTINKNIESHQKSEEIYISEPIIPEIKSEPIDPQEPLPMDDLEHKDSSLKLESKESHEYEDYGGNDSNYEGFDFDPTNENFDDGQSGSWENSQGFDGEEGNEDDPTQRDNYYSTTTSEAHTIDQMGQKCFKCPIEACGYITHSASILKIHYRIHTGEKPFKCPSCRYRAAQKNNIDLHVRAKHTQDKRFHCPSCEFKTSRKFTLKQHMYTLHNSPLDS